MNGHVSIPVTPPLPCWPEPCRRGLVGFDALLRGLFHLEVKKRSFHAVETTWRKMAHKIARLGAGLQPSMPALTL